MHSFLYLESLQVHISIFLNFIARVLGSAMRTPFDVVKQRVQVGHISHRSEYNSIISAAKHIWKHEGFKGLFGTGF